MGNIRKYWAHMGLILRDKMIFVNYLYKKIKEIEHVCNYGHLFGDAFLLPFLKGG